MDSTCLQRLRRREMEGGYTIPRRTCRGRPIVCPGPCNPRFKTAQRQEIRYNAEVVKTPQYSQATETTYEQVYGQATTFEQGIMYEEIMYGADGQTLETVAVDRMTTYNEVTLQTTTSKQFVAAVAKASKGSGPASGQPAPRSEALQAEARSEEPSSQEATTREQADDPSDKSTSKPITVDGGTTGGSIGVRAETPVGTSTDTPAVQITGEMTGADCTRCLFMCLKAFVLAVVRLARKLGGNACKVEPPACFIGLAIFIVFHAILATIAWQMPQYQVFLSSQICGVLAAVSWSVTRTIPLLDPTPTIPSCVCQPCA